MLQGVTATRWGWGGARRRGIHEDSQRRGLLRQGCVTKPRPYELSPARERKEKAKVIVNMLADVSLRILNVNEINE